MGYRGFSNDELQAAILERAKDAPSPTSRAGEAQRAAVAEWERRRTAPHPLQVREPLPELLVQAGVSRPAS